MNPGAAEEAGKTAGIFMEIMRGQPLALALVICNLVLLGLFFYVANLASTNRRHEFELVLESQKEVQKLLYNCVPAGGRSEFKLQSDESRAVEIMPLAPLPRPRPREAPDE